ncbi:MAG TPA: DoxX family membrane protein, partial [Nocardioides sp.]
MTSTARTTARILLGVIMVGAGVAHLTTQRQEFRAQVPDWFPVDEDLTVVGSGVVEIGLGLAFVLLPSKRRLVGALLAAFFVAIFPGNIA